jgi:hypothetical protein
MVIKKDDEEDFDRIMGVDWDLTKGRPVPLLVPPPDVRRVFSAFQTGVEEVPGEGVSFTWQTQRPTRVVRIACLPFEALVAEISVGLELQLLSPMKAHYLLRSELRLPPVLPGVYFRVRVFAPIACAQLEVDELL